MRINSRTSKKVNDTFLELVEERDKRLQKLDGPGILVEVDETALIRKTKALLETKLMPRA